MKEIIDKYKIEADGVIGEVVIYLTEEENVPIYDLRVSELEKGTAVLMEQFGISEQFAAMCMQVELEEPDVKEKLVNVMKTAIVMRERERLEKIVQKHNEDKINN